LGPYEILAPLGAGGMGEVYRARDARLSREVAIKVLPAAVASDPERLKRFEKEARAASALNHPSIVTIYDVGVTDGVSWIAMELVEGKTLRELLASGALPVKRILQLSTPVADGLARAHEAGIVHRDLKPENLMVARDGLVKILDFGLAKRRTSPGGKDETSTPTETATEAGVVFGTVGYMSPEQVAGKEVDFRSDQFSFGAVLYEMVTGTRAFAKKTAVETMNSILNEDPTPAEAPAPVRWIMDRCLAKEPEERYASTRDLAKDLAMVRDRLAEAATSGEGAGLGATWRRSRAPFALVALALALVAAAAFWVGHRTGEKPPPSFRRLTFRRGTVIDARFARDGHSVVYSAAWDGNPPQVFTTRLDGPGFLRLPLPSANLFSVSGSGELAIGIGDRLSTLARVPLSGGGPREILEHVWSADWSPTGESLAVAYSSAEGARLDYPIGRKIASTNGYLSSVHVSPDGERVAFADHPVSISARGSVAVVDRAGKKTTLTQELPLMVTLAWSPRGDEVWYSAPDDSFRAVSLSGRERVVMRTAGGGGIEDTSRDGRALLSLYNCRGAVMGVPGGETKERDLSWFDNSSAADLSADGKTLLFREAGKGAASPLNDAYVRKLDGSDPVRLGVGDSRALSPDGKWALVVVNTTPPTLEMLPTAAGEKRSIARGDVTEYRRVNWFPDGRGIFFEGLGPDSKPRVYVQGLDGGQPEPLTEGGIGVGLPVSPDGRFLVARMPDGSWRLLEVANQGFLPLPGVEPADSPIGFTADGQAIFVERSGEAETSIFRVALATGRREPYRTIVASDPLGIEFLGRVRMTPDGSSYVYSYLRCLSDLYLVEGLH
jgi:Tol biopolymer transport system component